MLERKFYQNLIHWKENHEKECLLINGARQVGKTFLVEHFGAAEYASCISINFIKNPEYKAIFEGPLDPSSVIKRLSLQVSNARIVPRSTLLFLDEIQACRKARTALKFLALDERIDVIASGSLLGIHYKRDEDEPDSEISIPVGYEREVIMHSLDFEEFLWARGVTREASDLLRDAFKRREKLDEGTLDRLQGLLREYLVVGGMPAVVDAYVETDDFQRAYEEQEKILRAYEADIEKYATDPDKPKIRQVYRSLPRQLAKEYTKFQFSKIEKRGTERKFGSSIDWLIDAGLVSSVSNVSLPILPLRAYEKPGEFKIYASDIGLCTHMFGFETQSALFQGLLKGPAKGGIYENLIFDMLSKRGKSVFYYKRENSEQEIEFFVEEGGEAVPVEVKSKRGATPSLNAYIEQYRPQLAYKLIDGNIGEDGCKVTLPQFMAMFV